MAITYQSVGTLSYTNTNAPVITKPTGLASGDLMVAVLHQKNGSGRTCTRTGWTAIDSMNLDATTGDVAWTLYKVADSTDAAASNFTFTLSGTENTAGAIFRISGQATSSIINGHAYGEDGSNRSNHSVSATVTPTVANCLIILATFNSNNVTTSSYAINTDSPTFTQAFDVGSAGAARSFSGAYGNRPQTTATGGISFTTSSSGFDSATIIAIAPLASTQGVLLGF